MIANAQYVFSLEEYLEWEERQEIRYEYINGKVYAIRVERFLIVELLLILAFC